MHKTSLCIFDSEVKATRSAKAEFSDDKKSTHWNNNGIYHPKKLSLIKIIPIDIQYSFYGFL